MLGELTFIRSIALSIAAGALATGATLVTDNVVEFQRVLGLSVVNWLNESA